MNSSFRCPIVFWILLLNCLGVSISAQAGKERGKVNQRDLTGSLKERLIPSDTASGTESGYAASVGTQAGKSEGGSDWRSDQHSYGKNSNHETSAESSVMFQVRVQGAAEATFYQNENQGSFAISGFRPGLKIAKVLQAGDQVTAINDHSTEDYFVKYDQYGRLDRFLSDLSQAEIDDGHVTLTIRRKPKNAYQNIRLKRTHPNESYGFTVAALGNNTRNRFFLSTVSPVLEQSTSIQVGDEITHVNGDRISSNISALFSVQQLNQIQLMLYRDPTISEMTLSDWSQFYIRLVSHHFYLVPQAYPQTTDEIISQKSRTAVKTNSWPTFVYLVLAADGKQPFMSDLKAIKASGKATSFLLQKFFVVELSDAVRFELFKPVLAPVPLPKY